MRPTSPKRASCTANLRERNRRIRRPVRIATRHSNKNTVSPEASFKAGQIVYTPLLAPTRLQRHCEASEQLTVSRARSSGSTRTATATTSLKSCSRSDMTTIRRTVDYPWVLVRLRCDVCKRAGAYRLARLAEKYGAEILLDDLIVRLSSDCPWRDEPRGTCGARFSDLPPRARAICVIAGGRKQAERWRSRLTFVHYSFSIIGRTEDDGELALCPKIIAFRNIVC
jgi:hypothetical protein